MLLQRDRFAYDTVLAGTDEALCAWSVPAETTVLSVKGTVLMTGLTDLGHARRASYAMDGWMLELPDDLMETAISTVYDALVPKYVASLSFDFEDEVADTSPGFEPGEIRNDLLGMVDQPDHIYQRRKILGFPNTKGYHETVPGSSWAFVPSDHYSISRVGRRTADGMSAVIFGCSSPENDGLSSETKLFPNFGGTARSEWLWLKFLPQLLDKAIVEMLGLTETGAETPYENLLDLLEFEISSANVLNITHLSDMTWDVYMAATMKWETTDKARIRLASD